MLRMLIIHLLEGAILTASFNPAVTAGPAEARFQPPEANTHPAEEGQSCPWAWVSSHQRPPGAVSTNLQSGFQMTGVTGAAGVKRPVTSQASGIIGSNKPTQAAPGPPRAHRPLPESRSRWLCGLRALKGKEGLGQGRQPASGWGLVPSDPQVLRLRSLGSASVSPSSPISTSLQKDRLGLVSPARSPHWALWVCQVRGQG